MSDFTLSRGKQIRKREEETDKRRRTDKIKRIRNEVQKNR